jgi:hypothetical protein
MRVGRLLSVAGILLMSALPAVSAPLGEAQKSLLAKGHRFQRAGWIYLHAEGSLRARGFQHGYLLAPEIQEALRVTRIQWEHLSALPWSWLVGKADAMLTAKVDPENLAEIDGIVEGLAAAGVASSRAELVTYNAQPELFSCWWPQEFKKLKEGAKVPVPESCSAFIATGSWTRDGGVVVGHNTMNTYEAPWCNFVMDLVPEQGHCILMQAAPGCIHSGTDFFVTSAGLVGTETTLGGFANAWLLGDVNTGEIARLELGLNFVAFERTKDGFFTGSNIADDPRILRFETNVNETDIRDCSVARRVRWQQHMAAQRGKLDLGMAKRFEAEHFDAFFGRERIGGRGLCAHHELEREPAGPWPGVPYGPAGTLDAKVMDSKHAKAMSFSARWGAACGRPFDARAFLAKHPQFGWMKDILKSRPSQPWTTFTAGDRK